MCYIYIYSKISLNRLTMGPTLSGTSREVVGLALWAIVWDRIKAIDIGECSVCGGGWL